jgi:aminodeoxyfutalosine deaminase
VTILRARHLRFIGPVPIDDGCVVIDNEKIIDIGPTSRINPQQIDVDIPGLLLPGLINFHTHLELTNVARPPVAESFQQWILDVAGIKNSNGYDITAAVTAGVAQCIRFGVTQVWDITQHAPVVRPVLAQSSIRSVSFGECLGIGSREPRFDLLLAQALDRTYENTQMQIGISPHAPYTVNQRGYALALAAAQQHNIPLMTHLAETPDESRFLLDSGGPFGALYNAIASNPGTPSGFVDGPVKWLAAINHQRIPLIAVHCNYCDDNELALLADMNATIVWCPRTHAYFGHPLPHPAMRRINNNKTNVEHSCRQNIDQNVMPTFRIGTDSCASSGNLNLVDDLRLAHQYGMSAETLFQNAVTQCDIGCAADLVAFEIDAIQHTSDPCEAVLRETHLLPTGVWINGRRVVT